MEEERRLGDERRIGQAATLARVEQAIIDMGREIGQLRSEVAKDARSLHDDLTKLQLTTEANFVAHERRLAEIERWRVGTEARADLELELHKQAISRREFWLAVALVLVTLAGSVVGLLAYMSTLHPHA